MLTIKKKVVTYKDYQHLPEGAPYQLIRGELIMTPAPTPFHQIISKRLERELLELQDKGLGVVFYAPIDVFLSETETYQPDLLFIVKNRLNIIGENKIDAAPDLVIEILSPGTAYYDLKHKMTVYGQKGVREYWIVDPQEKSIEVFENRKGSYVLLNQASEEGTVFSGIFPSLKIEIDSTFSSDLLT